MKNRKYPLLIKIWPFKIFILGLMAAISFLPGCDLGDFEPFNFFEREALQDSTVSLKPGDAGACGISYIVSGERIAEAEGGYRIKGSVYFDLGGDPLYFTNGEFFAAANDEGSLLTLSGYGLARFPDIGIFENGVMEKDFGASYQMNKGSILNENELPLEEDVCYVYGEVDNDIALLKTQEGTFEFSEFFLDPTDPFVLFNGNLNLRKTIIENSWIGISYTGQIEFVPEQGIPDLPIEPFKGHIFTRGEIPFEVNNVPIISNGDNVINAAPGIDDDPLLFFDGLTENLEQGTNGNLLIGYKILDILLAEHSYYQDRDTLIRSVEFINLTNSTSYWEINDNVETYYFLGSQNDTTDFYKEALPGHPAFEYLSLQEQGQAFVYGIYGNNINTMQYNIVGNAQLTLEDFSDIFYTDAILTIDAEKVSFSGIYETVFKYIPSMELQGVILDNGDFNFSGQAIAAINYDGTTLPTTFYISQKVIDGVPDFTISAEAEQCNGGNCVQIPVEVNVNHGNLTVELCINIPGRGNVCIN
ncbi:hypothetical protein [Flexithrix dorotheae]|uniref:hypothetical protein n=1 Tax=Flexithrix dorotheae TaxID=70993 RepID=UPI0003796A55|nr:hypothetical protein [Flexithrix dorotheae]